MIDTFDVVIQLSRAKLLNYILENVQIKNLPIVPKFSLAASSQDTNFTSYLDGVDLQLNPGTDQITLTYHVCAASIYRSGQPEVGISDGEVQFTMKLLVGTPFQIKFESVAFQTSQTSGISDTTAFFNDVNAALTSIIDTTKQWNLFPNTPDQTALALTEFAFSGNVSCLDANTVVATAGTGNLKNVKNFLNFEDFALAMAAPLVKNNLLFPAELSIVDAQTIADALGISLADAQNMLANPTPSFINQAKPFLPAPFGTGSIKQTTQGVDIFYDFIDFTLENGFIQMDGKLHGEGFCAHITDGAFTEKITLSIANQQIVATFLPNPPEPTYSVNFDFWCGFGFIFLASNVALVTGIVVTAVIISVVTSMQVQQQELDTNPFSIPAFDQISWNGVEIFTDSLILLGTSSASVGYDTTESRIDINPTLKQQNVEDLGPGTYHFPGNLSCPTPRDFSYEEFSQDVVVTLNLEPTELLLPAKSTTWTVHGQNITSGSGQITYTDLAHTATPPFNETALPNHQIEIDYVVDPFVIINPHPKFFNGLTVLQLTMPKSDYNFNLLVQVAVVDASGITYNAQYGLAVQTDIVQFGADFQQFQQQCGLASKLNIGKIKTIPQGVLHGGETLTPVEVTNVVREIAATQSVQKTVAIVQSLSSTYGAAPILNAFSPNVAAIQARLLEE